MSTSQPIELPENALPASLQGLLAGVALHRGFLDADYLAAMAAAVDEAWTVDRVDELIEILESKAALWDCGSGVFQIEAKFAERLRARETSPAERDAWAAELVRAMASLAAWLAPLDWHEQRVPYTVHRLNVQEAVEHARRLGMGEELLALLEVSAECSLSAGLLDEAAALYDEIVASTESAEDSEVQAAACHQRGLVAQQQGRYDEAARWYGRALEIEERIGDLHGAAMSEHQMARLEQERGRLEEAESLFLRAVAGLEQAGDAEHAAVAWRQLGQLAQGRGDRARAKRLYERSLERAQDVESVWEQANTLHQMGLLAHESGQTVEARLRYERAIELREADDEADEAAADYRQLGVLALEQGDLGEAERLLRKSYGSERRRGNDSGAAMALALLGVLAARQGDFPVAGRRLIRATAVHQALGEKALLDQSAAYFLKIWRRSTDATRAELRGQWEAAGLEWPQGLPD